MLLLILLSLLSSYVFCTVASPAARLSPAALPPHQREQEQQHWWALRSFFDQKPKGEYPLPMFLSTREQHQPFANGGDGQPDFAALFQYLNKRNLHSSAVSPDIGGTSMGYEEMVDGGQRDIRSPLGTMRFGKRGNPLGTMRFGK